MADRANAGPQHWLGVLDGCWQAGQSSSLSNRTREREKKELEHEAQSKALVYKGLDTLTIIFVVLFLSICMFYPVKVTRTSKKTFESTYFLFQHQ